MGGVKLLLNRRNYDITFQIILAILIYIVLFVFYLSKVMPYPFLGIKLIPLESQWIVENLMTTGIGKEMDVKKGDIVLTIDGSDPQEHFIVKKWFILEQVHQFAVDRSGEVLNFEVPMKGNHNLYPFITMVFLSLLFLFLGLYTYYKKYYFNYMKYFLIFNMAMALSLLSTVPSSLGILPSRIIFCLGLFWAPYYLIQFISYFPINIHDSSLARTCIAGFRMISIVFTLFVFYHLLFELPVFMISFLIKWAIAPTILSLIVVSLLLGWISMRKIDFKERYQVSLLLFCSVFGFLPTILFYAFPTIWRLKEVSFVGTAFFLFIFPLVCSYIMVKKGILSFRLHFPNIMIQSVYAFIVVIVFFIISLFYKITENLGLIFLFSFLFFMGMQMFYQRIIHWNQTRIMNRKEIEHNQEGIHAQFSQSYYVTQLLEFMLLSLNRMIHTQKSSILWLRNYDTVLIHSGGEYEKYARRLKVDKRRELTISPESTIEDSVVFKLETKHGINQNDHLLGYLIIWNKHHVSDENMKHVHHFNKQLTAFLHSTKQLDSLRNEYLNLMNKYKQHTWANGVVDYGYDLIESLESEKESISHYLHDTVIQNLVFAIRDLKDLKTKQNKGWDKHQFNEVLEKFEDALYELRQLCFDLYPSMVEEIGFKRSIDYLVREVKKKENLLIEPEYETFVESALSLTLKVAIFRIIKELINNVIKHANATKVHIYVKMVDDALIVKVIDNGKGMDPLNIDKPYVINKHFGLVSIKQKVDYLHGDFEVFSEKNSGTKVILSIPVLKKDDEGHERAN